MTEAINKRFWLFMVRGVLITAVLLGVVAIVNYLIDSSEVIRPGLYPQMARLSQTGNVIETPLNYNERFYQVTVIDEMKELPETIVIGCSRGMFLGKEITGYENVYNNCVSGACLEDYYAILGLYQTKYSSLPERIIMEVSPWVFYRDNPEARWVENPEYRKAAESFYYLINGRKLNTDIKKENPFLSISYFQHNITYIIRNGLQLKEKKAVISTDPAKKAENPDGTIRYGAESEYPSEKRTENVKKTNGAVVYEDVDNMQETDMDLVRDFENLLRYLNDHGSELIIYMQPFSVTQCEFIYDKETNTVFEDVEDYLNGLNDQGAVRVIGGFDARDFDLSDEDFIDFMHLDKAGTDKVWNAYNPQLKQNSENGNIK